MTEAEKRQDDKSKWLARVLEDVELCSDLIHLCRIGRVRAEGRRLFLRKTEYAPGEFMYDYDPEIAPRYEPIPPDDWVLGLSVNPNGIRLEGWRESIGSPASLFKFIGWDDVQFDMLDLLTFPAAAASTESRRGVPARCEAPTKKARGPVPKVMPRLIAEMRKIPRAELASMKTSEMEDHFNASHRWVIKARCTVLEDGYDSAQEEL
jgi:hypothetical protein